MIADAVVEQSHVQRTTAYLALADGRLLMMEAADAGTPNDYACKRATAAHISNRRLLDAATPVSPLLWLCPHYIACAI